MNCVFSIRPRGVIALMGIVVERLLLITEGRGRGENVSENEYPEKARPGTRLGP